VLRGAQVSQWGRKLQVASSSKLRRVGTALLVLLGGVMGFPASSVVSAEFTHRMFRNKLTSHFPCICRSPGATEVRIAAVSWVRFAVWQWLAVKLFGNWRHCRHSNLSLCSRCANTKKNAPPFCSVPLCVETCLYVTLPVGLQWRCLLYVTRVGEPKEKFPSPSLGMVGRTLIITLVYWTKTRGPRLTGDWSIGERVLSPETGWVKCDARSRK